MDLDVPRHVIATECGIPVITIDQMHQSAALPSPYLIAYNRSGHELPL
jgi:hypothetical protein